MGNIIKFTPNKDVVVIAGQTVKRPTTREEYRLLCKRLLTDDDYCDVLISIMDREKYDRCESVIKGVVDSYFSFPQ
jgi:hypothetical protein